MAAFTKRTLGATGLKVGPLGVAASYGAPAEAFEAAFEKGCNYFYLGSGRHKAGMSQAIRNLCRQGQRDKLVIAVQTYARFGFLTEWIFKRRLKSMGLKQADILILGLLCCQTQCHRVLCAGACETGPGNKGQRSVSVSGHVRTSAQAVPKDDRRRAVRPVSRPLQCRPSRCRRRNISPPSGRRPTGHDYLYRHPLGPAFKP